MSEHQLSKQNQSKAIPVIEEQGRALMQAVPDLVFLLGLDGRYIDIFSAADEDLFLPREQLIGRTVLEVLKLMVLNEKSSPEQFTPRQSRHLFQDKAPGCQKLLQW